MRQPTRLIRPLAAAVALLFVADVVAVGVHEPPPATGPSAREAAPRPTTTAPVGTATGPSGDDLTAIVRELQTFVAEERGLAFESDVEVALVADAEFRKKLLEEQADPEEVAELGRILRALGLVDDIDDFDRVLEGLLGDAVAGFYDPETKELYVRGGEATPYVRQVIAHELVHALQDQHFGLDRPELEDVDDEREVAFSALVEGDAVRIDEAYRRSLSEDDRRRAAREEQAQASAIGDDVPFPLLYLLAFPYIEGPDFTEALLEAGGQERLDRAFREPPETSEHILHPDRFLRGEPALQVQKPAAGGEIIDQGVLGEMGLQLVLAPVVGPEAEDAADGWGGDWYVAWDDGDRTCFRIRIVMDDPGDRMELKDALVRWARRQPGATVEGDSPMVMTSCA